MNRPYWWHWMPLVLALLVCWTGPAHGAHLVKGKIKSVIPEKNQIVVTDENNKDHLIHLTDQTRMRLDTTKTTTNRGDRPATPREGEYVDYAIASKKPTFRQLLGLDPIEGETIGSRPRREGEYVDYATASKKPTFRQLLDLDLIEGETYCSAPPHRLRKLQVHGLKVGDAVAISCSEKDKLVLATEIFRDK